MLTIIYIELYNCNLAQSCYCRVYWKSKCLILKCQLREAFLHMITTGCSNYTAAKNMLINQKKLADEALLTICVNYPFYKAKTACFILNGILMKLERNSVLEIIHSFHQKFNEKRRSSHTGLMQICLKNSQLQIKYEGMNWILLNDAPMRSICQLLSLCWAKWY